MKFKIGDRVKLLGDEKGTIIDTEKTLGEIFYKIQLDVPMEIWGVGKPEEYVWAKREAFTKIRREKK